MPELEFAVESAEPLPFAASPHLLFKLRVRDAATLATPIHSAMLHCQIRIEPTRRRYSTNERHRLFELFGPPRDWDRTLHSMLWTHVNVFVPPFTGEMVVEAPVACSYDFNVAATKYFAALDDGDIPLCLLFSGTVFYQGGECGMRVSQISWEKEASYRLSAATWKAMMDRYYPGCIWTPVPRDVFDRIDAHKRRQMLSSWEQALESLLPPVEEQVPT